MKINNKKRLLIEAGLLGLLILWTLWGNTALQTSEYVIRSSRIPEAFSGFRIAQVSDLHNASFGRGNGRLLKQLSDARPDIIVITGDLVDSRNTDVEIALEFVGEAVKIAPVYYVSGNHEARIPEYPALTAGLEAAGASVLNDRKLRLERSGQFITLIGLADPSFRTDYLFGDAGTVVSDALGALMEADDGYTVLLSHRPELFAGYAAAGADLVFSGHAHGGQFRLPFVGGLVAPNQGILPRYDAGKFTDGVTTMLVSRGLGNSIIPLRFNNRPELIVAVLET